MIKTKGVSNIRVLVLEDDSVWQAIHKKTLQRGDCNISITSSIDQALHSITEERFHIVIIDLNLDPDQESNGEDTVYDGWKLVDAILENAWLEQTVVCIVSHWSDIIDLDSFVGRGVFDIDKLRSRRSSGINVEGVIYFSKNEFDADAFWGSLKRELQDKGLISPLSIEEGILLKLLTSRMTWNLVDHIETQSIHSELAENHGWIRTLYEVRGVESLNTRLEAEIEDLLLQSVHSQSKDIDLRQIGSGFSKASVVRVSSLLVGQWTNEVIVKMGYHREIKNEWSAYERYVAPLIMRCPPAQFGPKTPILSSIVYAYVGQASSFGTSYKRLNQKEFEQVLDDLFKVACRPWYNASAKQSKIGATQYIEYLHCYPERFEKPLEALSQMKEAQNISYHNKLTRFKFPDIDKDFINPVSVIARHEKLLQTYPAFFGITHGDFNANNILIRSNKGNYESIMIDFARTEEAHILRDFIQLETVVKFALLEEATLAERYQLEQALLKQSTFSDIANIRESYQATGANAEHLQRAFEIVCKIRELAWEVGLKGETDSPIYYFEQYQLGLFFVSMNTVRFLEMNTLSNGKPINALDDGGQIESVEDDEGIGVIRGITAMQALHALLASAMVAESLVRK